MKMGVFWDAAPDSLVDIDRRLRGAYYLHHQGDDRPESIYPDGLALVNTVMNLQVP
jgi:hypothetical protein